MTSKKWYYDDFINFDDKPTPVIRYWNAPPPSPTVPITTVIFEENCSTKEIIIIKFTALPESENIADSEKVLYFEWSEKG